jgi:hypothetical protein
LADWKQNVSAYIPVISAILAVFVIDVTARQYLTPANTPLLLAGNVLWVVAVIGGVLWYYNRRWPKIDEEKAARIAIQYISSKYEGESIQIHEIEYVGLKWRVRLEYYANTVAVPRLLIIDAGTGAVESDDVSLETPNHIDLV